MNKSKNFNIEKCGTVAVGDEIFAIVQFARREALLTGKVLSIGDKVAEGVLEDGRKFWVKHNGVAQAESLTGGSPLVARLFSSEQEFRRFDVLKRISEQARKGQDKDEFSSEVTTFVLQRLVEELASIH